MKLPTRKFNMEKTNSVIEFGNIHKIQLTWLSIRFITCLSKKYRVQLTTSSWYIVRFTANFNQSCQWLRLLNTVRSFANSGRLTLKFDTFLDWFYSDIKHSHQLANAFFKRIRRDNLRNQSNLSSVLNRKNLHKNKFIYSFNWYRMNPRVWSFLKFYE